jgi:Uma2 family endonuclease
MDLTELLPVTFTKPGLTEEEYFELCAEFDDYFVEYAADGTVIIMPGKNPNGGRAANLILFRLARWSLQQGQGFVTGPDTSFLFPNGARRQPDAAWVNDERWKVAIGDAGSKKVPGSLPNS